MISAIQSLLRDVEGRARDGAQHLLLWLAFCVSVWLIGMAGIGFVIASAYLALWSLLGAGWAAVLIGLVLTGLAVGLWAFTIKRGGRAIPDTSAPASPAPPSAASSAEASTVAFTAAYVLGRYLTRDSHSDEDRR